MKPISFDGVTFSSLNVSAGFNPIFAGPYRSPQAAQRFGGNPVHGGVSQDVELRTVTFHPKPGYTIEDTLLQLIGKLDVLNPRERPFTALLNDGVTTVTRNMAINTFRSIGTNQVEIDFSASDPLWRETSATTVSQSGSVSPFSASVTNAGQSVVHPIYRIGWSVQRSVFGAVVGQKWRKRITLVNFQDRTLAPFPWMFNLSDTAALVSGSKAQADGDDVRIIYDGDDLTRQLNGFNLVQSFAWVTIPGMDANETVYLDLVYGNASATNPPTWTDPDPDKPVIDIAAESGTATGGSTSTIVKATGTWDTNRWKNGRAYILTGAAAGSTQVILSNTPTTITLNGFVSAAVGAGDTFLLIASDNGRWAWGVRQTDRETDYARGRWYVNSPRLTPSVVSFEAPGSWRPELVLDNRDSMGQKRFSMIDVGGDKDPYTILDAQRMWEGNDGHVYNAGTADGVSFTSPQPIFGIYWAYQFDNPNAMVKAWIGVRGSGAEDWSEVWTDELATTALTTFTPAFIDVYATYGPVYQIAQALLPIDDIEIGLDWKRDTGSLSSATTTVSTDSSKEWATDQFDNGKIRMLSGVNAGKVRSITGNTPTAITHSAFPAASGDGDRYLVYNSRLKGRLLDDATLSITFYNTSTIANLVGSETEVYELSCTLWVGAGPSADPAGQHRALIGYAAGSKRLFLTADEQLVIDSDLRKIRIYDTVALEYTATLTDPMVIVQWHNGTEWVRSADWLPLGLGSQLVWLEETNMGTLDLDVEYYPAYIGT